MKHLFGWVFLNGNLGSKMPNKATLPDTCAVLQQDKVVFQRVFYLSGLLSSLHAAFFFVFHKPSLGRFPCYE